MAAQNFFVGHTASARCRYIDLSDFEDFQQLKSYLGKVFSFVEPETIQLRTAQDAPLDTLEDIKASVHPVEVRDSQDNSVKEPPGPRPLPVVGNTYELYPDSLGNYDRLFSRYGPMIQTTVMGTTLYHTNDPEIARHILREGDHFTKTTSDPSHPLHYMNEQDMLFTCDSASPAFQPSHKFVPPSMSPRAIATYTPLIQQAVRSSFPVFDELAQSDQAFNVYQFMFKLASQIIWRVILNQDLKHFESIKTPPALPLRLFGQYLSLMKESSLRPQWFKHLPFGEPARLRVVRQQMFDECEKALHEIVDTKRPALALKDPESAQKANCVADFLYHTRDEKGEGLAYDLLLGNVVVVLGAGFTTSSSLLSWAIYSLVRYAGNQERILQELINAGADGERSWTYDEIHSLKFLDCFVKEVLRLHSPSFQTARNVKQDVVLPGGYLIPRGSIVIACFPSIHKHIAYWDNPQRFDPDRWLPKGFAAQQARKGAYTPFAVGGRGCVGFNLALTQVKLALIELVYRYTFEDASPRAVVYDPDFLVVRPLNFYAAVNRRGGMK
ncbi:hypothetical protein BST61_g5481 [Cercospora zeina]